MRKSTSAPSIDRKRKLMAMQRRISLARNKPLIGREFPVLVEGPSKETELLWEARLQPRRRKSMASAISTILDQANARPGEIRTLRVTEAHDYDLVGELVGRSRAALQSGPEPAIRPFCHQHLAADVARPIIV